MVGSICFFICLFYIFFSFGIGNIYVDCLQDECWFRPSLPLSTFKLNAAEILEERLKTLEKVATAMATAVVIKGNEISVNRHSDYEFFVSRRRY